MTIEQVLNAQNLIESKLMYNKKNLILPQQYLLAFAIVNNNKMLELKEEDTNANVI